MATVFESDGHMTPAEQEHAAKEFVARWKASPCVEEEHSRSFWIELLQDVLGIPNATHTLEFERKVKGRTIDVFYEDMGILIEQKGRGISLDKASERSSNYSNATFDQLMDQARSEEDASARGELYRQADDLLVNQDVACLPLVWPQRQFVAQEGVEMTASTLEYRFNDVAKA